MNLNKATSIVSLCLFLVLVFFFAVSLAVRYRKRKRENEALKARLTTERLKIQVEIQEETLQHISRELHDNLGHIASLVKIHLNTIITNDEVINAKLEDAREITRQLIADIKQLSVRLSDNAVAQKGLLAALEKEVERLNKTGLFHAVLHTEGNIPYMESDKALILYRMTQECINNTIKHSDAKNILISIVYIEKSIILVVRDDGRGFDISNSQYKGAGLSNLRNRATLLSASIDMDSQAGRGTQITIKMPYDNAP